MPPPPIPLDVVSIEIVDDYLPHGEEPYVDQKMSPHPMKTLHEWLEKNIKPTGRVGSARIRIQEVSMRWQKRPGKMESSGYWPYRGIMRVCVEIFDKEGLAVGSSIAEATRVREVNESFFGGNKQDMWSAMMQELQTSLAIELRRMLPKIVKATAKAKVVTKPSTISQEKDLKTHKAKRAKAHKGPEDQNHKKKCKKKKKKNKDKLLTRDKGTDLKPKKKKKKKCIPDDEKSSDILKDGKRKQKHKKKGRKEDARHSQLSS